MSAINHFKPKIEGRGIRRLNRMPLFVTLGLFGVAVAAIGYTYIQRVNDTHAKPETATPTKTGPVTAADPSEFLAKAPAGSVILPDRPRSFSAPTAPNGSPLPGVMPGTMPANGNFSSAPQAGQLSPEEQERRRQWADYYNARRDISSRREKAAASALDAQTSTRKHGDGDAAAAESNTSVMRNGVMTPAGSSAGLAGLIVPGIRPAATPTNLGAFATNTNGATPSGLTSRLPPSRMPGASSDDPNNQYGKAAYLNLNPDETLSRTREAPASPFEIRQGTVFPAVMIGGLNSDLPGQITAQISEDIRDTATGNYILIPQGSHLVGNYDNGVTYGQERILVVWNRVIFPDGSALTLNKMPGADQSGFSGFYDQVNNHYMRIFGSTVLMSVLSATAQLSQPQAANGANVTPSQTVAGAIGQNVAQSGTALMQKNLGIAPTLWSRPGYPFNVMVTKDIIFNEPWVDDEPSSAPVHHKTHHVQIASTPLNLDPGHSVPGSQSATPVSAPAAVKPEPLWTINAGESLTDAVTRWAGEAGWVVPPHWQTKDHWTILFAAQYRGSFEHAVEWLCSGFTNQAEIPTPIFWPNRVIDLTSTPNPNVAPQSNIGEFQ
ncbi:MAG: TcpQ domain-containing protein [Magnetospirillum sp.]|nr:TcpQ domain-containing protein [Magnetospirillum sp.]